MTHALIRSTLLLLVAFVAVPLAMAQTPERAASLEHEFTLLVGIEAQGESESEKLYAARRKKTQDEVLRRLLRRYNTLGVRDLKGIPRGTSGVLRMSMRAKRSPGFIQAVALGEGRVQVKPMRHQDELWMGYADPSSELSASLPPGVEVVDTEAHGLVLQSEDPASLQKFVAEFAEFSPQLVLSKSSLHMVRGPSDAVWHTLWLGEPKLDTSAVDRVSLKHSPHTGATFAQVHLSDEGTARWKSATADADAPLVLVLDSEPVAVVHRPEAHTMLTTRSEHERVLSFGCNPIWVGGGDIDECTSLVAARASAFIPLRIALGAASAAP